MGSNSAVPRSGTSLWLGRRAAEVGIALDLVETIMSAVPDFGGGAALGRLDAGVTLVSGFLLGENYLPWDEHPLFPDIRLSINQDLIVNGTEAFIGETAPIIATALGASTAIVTGPDGVIVSVGSGLIASKMIDAMTSSASAIYDLGRYRGDFDNHLTIGVSSNGPSIVMVYWP
jgi:hypothetical protein